jgi:hypothetical protein
LFTLSPGNPTPSGTLFVVLKAYFDGSVSSSKAMTLAAIAADEATWSNFEPQWKYVLEDRGGASYSHMKEAMPLEGIFRGWQPENRDWLIQGLKDLIAEFNHAPKFRVFTCTVDLEAHARWKRQKQHPSPERLCARILFPRILDWYQRFPDPIVDVIEMFFDRNERFMGHIQTDWNNKKLRKRFPMLELIRTVAPAEMRLTPPIQAADMVAWARNRLAVPPDSLSPFAIKPVLSVGDNFSLMAKLIYLATDKGQHYTLDETQLATRRFPENNLKR